MIVGYICAAKKENDTAAGCKAVKDYAAAQGLAVEIIYNGMSIEELCCTILAPKDVLIVDAVDSLGNSLVHIREIMHVLSEKGITLYVAAEDYVCRPQDKGWLSGFDLAVELRRGIASRCTAEALSLCKAKGIKLGMKKGARLKKKLDGQENRIRRFLEKGTPKTKIAKELGVSIVTLYNFIKNKNFKESEDA